MNIIKKIKDLFQKKNRLEEEKSKTEKLKEERDDIKLEIAGKLHQIGCSDEEIKNVLNIIETAEEEIQVIKDGLIGTNINPKGDPMQPISEGREKIRARYVQMRKDVQEAINKLIELHSK